MTAALRRMARGRAGGHCEYCRLPQESSMLPFHIEHIVPRQHGGVTSEDNLALACPHCNLHKGPNLTGIDPDSGEICRLFHPRRDLWVDHFRAESTRIEGRSAIGRSTAWVLGLNAEDQLRLRSAGSQ